MFSISADQLIAYVRSRQAELGGTMVCALRQLSASFHLANHILDEDWVQSKISVDRHDGFFHNGPASVPWRNVYEDRVVALGEMLFNLQGVRGVESRIAALRTENIEAVFGELEAASLLRRAAVPFHFVVPSGTRGTDYDFVAIIGASRVSCEAKVKLTSTVPSQASIENSLGQARGQLPSGDPAIVFVRVPSHWLATSDHAKTIDNAITAAFRDSRRFTAVIVQWEAWRRIQPLGFIRESLFRLWSNPRARIDLTAIRDAINTSTLSSPDWFTFDDLCDLSDRVRTQAIDFALRAERAIARGRLPDTLAGGIIAIGGPAATAPDGSKCITLVDFMCDHFDLFDPHQSATSATVSFESEPLPNITVVRALDRSRYQIRVPGIWSDQPLGIRPYPRAPSLDLQAEPALADPYLTALARIFALLRIQHDLERPTHELTDLSIRHVDSSLTVTLFEVQYRYQSVRL